MGKFVIVAYRPRPGKEQELLQLTREHLPILRSQGLATDRPLYVMKSADGTIIEVFEWKSVEAMARDADRCSGNPARIGAPDDRSTTTRVPSEGGSSIVTRPNLSNRERPKEP